MQPATVKMIEYNYNNSELESVAESSVRAALRGSSVTVAT